MATQSLLHPRVYARPISSARVARKMRLHVRKDFLAIRLMLAAGLLIPALMAFHMLPASFPLLGIALGLLAVGGVMWLIRAGEVA